MAASARDDLSVIISASTEQLAPSLNRAAAMFQQFAQKVAKDMPGLGADAGALRQAAKDFRALKAMAAETGRSIATAVAAPFRGAGKAAQILAEPFASAGDAAAMLGSAVQVPFRLAGVAADTLAKTIDAPFKIAALGIHSLGAVAKLPFNAIAEAASHLPGRLAVPLGRLVGFGTGAIGTVASMAGGIISVVGKAATSVLGGLGHFAEGVGSIVGNISMSAFAFGKDAVRMAAELEQTTMAFTTILRSGPLAEGMIKDIRQFAASTPFNSRELIQSARGLLAYGMAADQVLPTMRMLGDVSATFGKDLDINRLTYLYGTLFAQQRAYTIDIKQFAMAGIPIWDELGKVMGKSSYQLQQMVEEGRIGRDEVTKAFVNMTSAGGRFAGMTAKLGQTTAGAWEQMSDAFDVAKIKFGQTLIEGLGLKSAFKDMEAFANRVEKDMVRIKPFVSFLGDVGRAVAQVGYEFVRAAPKVGDIFLKQLDTVAPKIGGAADSLRGILKDLSNFKIDPVKIAEFGVKAGESVIKISIETVNWIDKAGKAFCDGFLNPMMNGLTAIRGFATDIRRMVNKPVDLVNELRFGIEYPKPENMSWFGIQESIGINKPKQSDDDVIRNWRKVNDLIKEHEALPEGNLKKAFNLGELRRVREHFLSFYPFDNKAEEKLNQGVAPDLHMKPPKIVFDFDLSDIKKDLKDALADTEKLGREIVFAVKLEKRLAAEAKWEAEWREQLNAARRKAFAAHNLAGEVRAGMLPQIPAAFDLWSSIAGAVPAFEKQNNLQTAAESLRLTPMFGGVLGDLVAPRPRGVQLMGDFPTHLLELEKRLKEQYRPLNIGANSIEEALKGTSLGIKRDDLQKLLDAGRIDKGLFDRAWFDDVKSVADKFGIMTETRLPGAALEGSAEAARLEAMNLTGRAGQMSTTENLLEMILTAINSIAGVAGRVERAPTPRPVMIGP